MSAPSLVVAAPAVLPSWLELVRRKAEGLRFGEITIIVHDHEVTQIACTEKTRVPAASTKVLPAAPLT